MPNIFLCSSFGVAFSNPFNIACYASKTKLPYKVASSFKSLVFTLVLASILLGQFLNYLPSNYLTAGSYQRKQIADRIRAKAKAIYKHIHGCLYMLSPTLTNAFVCVLYQFSE